MHRSSATVWPGYEFSAALDPHRRASLKRSLETVFESNLHGPSPSVALVGWQSASLLDVAFEKASRIVIIEDNPEILQSIERVVIARQMGSKVTLVKASPLLVHLDERVDIALCYCSSVWFMEGSEVTLLRNVKHHVIKKQGTLIPRRFVHLLELANPDMEVGGIAMRIPRFSRPGEPIAVLGESKHFLTHEVAEGGPINTEIDDTIIVKPLISGRISALRLTTLIELAEGVTLTTSLSGVQSIIIPLRDDIEVKAGQPVSILVRYEIGEGMATARFAGRVLTDGEPGRWEFDDHDVTERFRKQLSALMDSVDAIGRGADLDKVVSYTIHPHGDVSRLTALFWTIDEEFRKPLREIVEGFRREASSELEHTPSDDVIYELMINVYRSKRGRG
jgi:hypothetical protein